MPENKKNTTTSKEGKSDKNRVIIIIGLIIILLLLGIIIVLLLRPDKTGSEEQSQPQSQEDRREVLVTEDNVKEAVESLDEHEYVPLGRYTAMMNFEWHFATGDSESRDSYVANAIENTNDIYFDIFLADDRDNAIYKSPVIPRGSEIKNIRLEKELEAGTYDCILVYHLIDEDQNTISTASFTLKIYIEK